MTDELVRGIRRIVGDLDEKPKGIGDAEARKPIGISRGIAYIGRDGGVSSSGSAEGGGNDTSPPNVPQPDTDPDNGAPGDTGGTNDGSTGGGTGNAVSGDAAAVDSKSLMGAEIGQITGTDPSSGALSSLNINTLEGIEFVPPDGWDSPDTPPADPGWTEGFWWRMQVGPTIYSDYTESGVVKGVFPSATKCSGDDTAGTWHVNGNCGDPNPGNYITTIRISCDTPPADITVCTVVPPTLPDEHPSDGVCAVVYDHSESGYRGHESDPDCSASQKTASDFTILRSQTQPDKYYRYTRMADGGTKVTQVDSGGAPVPGSITKTIGPDGRVNGFYDVSLDAGIN